jgi:hypothetical protein
MFMRAAAKMRKKCMLHHNWRKKFYVFFNVSAFHADGAETGG